MVLLVRFCQEIKSIPMCTYTYTFVKSYLYKNYNFKWHKKENVVYELGMSWVQNFYQHIIYAKVAKVHRNDEILCLKPSTVLSLYTGKIIFVNSNLNAWSQNLLTSLSDLQMPKRPNPMFAADYTVSPKFTNQGLFEVIFLLVKIWPSYCNHMPKWM